MQSPFSGVGTSPMEVALRQSPRPLDPTLQKYVQLFILPHLVNSKNPLKITKHGSTHHYRTTGQVEA